MRLEYDFTKFGEGQKFHTCLGIEYLYDDSYFYVLLFVLIPSLISILITKYCFSQPMNLQ